VQDCYEKERFSNSSDIASSQVKWLEARECQTVVLVLEDDDFISDERCTK